MSALREQKLENLDVAALTPLTPDVISRQATLNVGTIGHVAHGKSTVVRALSGVHTVKFKKEKERNITIRLGYANAKLYKKVKADGSEYPGDQPGLYTARGSATPDEFPTDDGDKYQLQRHVSFVDCPGHDILMATMLTGTAVMDAALLLVAANEPCPQPQTSEHLAAVEIMRLNDIIIVQNKCELLRKEETIQQMERIKSFVEGTIAQDAPIVPISAVKGYNTDVLAEYLCNRIPVPARDFVSPPQLMVIRSFDVNKPGQEVEDLRGGVVGGCILKGVLRVGDEVEIRPGAVSKNSSGEFEVTPIKTRIVTMNTEQNDLQYAVPGGLIGVGTLMDPTLTRSDLLVGQFVGHPGHLPSVYKVLEVKYNLLRKLLGVKSDAKGEKKTTRVSALKGDEVLLVNIGSKSAGCLVLRTHKEQQLAELKLTAPVCVEIGDKVALSRKIDKNWRLIGWGTVNKGTKIDIDE